MNILHTPDKNIKIALLKMVEGEDYSLLIKDKTSIHDILITTHKSHIRKQQLLAARYLLQELTTQPSLIIAYTTHGKPFIKDSEYHISISHTKQFIALILSKEKKVGIDIEILDKRILRIENKFLRPDEKSFINQNHYLEQLYIIWSTKEVLFKIHEKGGIIFKENLRIHPFPFLSKGTLQATIITNEYQKTYTVNYETIDDLIIVYALED